MLKDMEDDGKRIKFLKYLSKFNKYIIMFNINKIKVNSIELKKNKSLDIYKVQKDFIVKNTFHESSVIKSHVTADGDTVTAKKVVEAGVEVQKGFDFSTDMIKKGEDIAKLRAESSKDYFLGDVKAYKAFIAAKESFKLSLFHDCVYDHKVKENGLVEVDYITFSTSKNDVLCGSQTFNKIPILLNTIYKDFYIIRIVYKKTMTKEEFIEGTSKQRFQDMQLRRQLFNEIQKDLSFNEYSLLRDEDLLNPKVEFFTKDLPLIKFKFTDLVE